MMRGAPSSFYSYIPDDVGDPSAFYAYIPDDAGSSGLSMPIFQMICELHPS
jgi:hypothetical protein